MFSRYNYSRWDGTQRIEGLDADEILEALSEDFLREGDLRRALERLMRQGFQGRDGERRMGLQELMERLRNRRQQQLGRYNMSSVMEDIQKKLEEVKELERSGIQRRLDDASGRPRQDSSTDADSNQDQQGPSAEEGAAGEEGFNSEEGAEGAEGQQGQQGQRGQPRAQQASQRGQAGQMGQQTGQRGLRQPGQQQGQSGAQQGAQGIPEGVDPNMLRNMLEKMANRKLQFLDQLPEDVPGQIKELRDYEFMDDAARQAFEELLQMLQQQVMQQYFQGMQQAIQNMTPEDLKRIRDMVRELNQMLRDRQDGKEPDFDAFMQKYGDFFPGVNSLDDLIEQMQRQMAQMQALMDSMTPEMRDQLQGMVDQMLGDDRLRVDMMELAGHLDRLGPNDFRTRFDFQGDESLSLKEALDLMGQLQGMDELEQQMREARRLGDLDDIDADKVRQLLGDEEGQAMEQLQDLMKMLEEAGYIQRQGSRWELTARGMRKIGQKALQDIFAQLKRDRFGQHATISRGTGGERTDESKVYQFGDPFLLDLEKTLMNSLHRNGAGTPVRLQKDDFEVYRTELLTQSSTVLMLDMSMSMVYNYCSQAAKRVAVALESLIRGQFPRDSLSIVTFSRVARIRKAE